MRPKFRIKEVKTYESYLNKKWGVVETVSSKFYPQIKSGLFSKWQYIFYDSEHNIYSLTTSKAHGEWFFVKESAEDFISLYYAHLVDTHQIGNKTRIKIKNSEVIPNYKRAEILRQTDC